MLPNAPPPRLAFSGNLRGIVSVTAANFLFLINDSMLKLAGADLPPTELLFVRGVFAAALIAIVIVATGAHRRVHELWHPGVALRMIAEIGGAVFYLNAILRIPIANANAILQIVPLAITAVGAIFLGERVDWRRWTAIIVGFVGVVIVVRPGFAGFNAWSLVAVTGVLFVTLRDATTRMFPPGVPALLIAFATNVCVGAAATAIGFVLGEPWRVPATGDLALIVGAAVFLNAGFLAAVDYMRHGDISVVAPFRYTVVLWAAIVGFLVWGDVPDWPMIVGMAIITAAGIYTFRRETDLARLREEAEAGEGL